MSDNVSLNIVSKKPDKHATPGGTVATKVLTTEEYKSLQDKYADKRTTLNPDYQCDVCGEPAMTRDGGQLRCPSCWLREQGQKIKPLDRGGRYP